MNTTPCIFNDYKPETLSLLNALTTAGFALVDGNNGGEQFKFDGNLDAFIDNLIACDESTLRIKVPGRDHPLTLWLVLGNEPGVLVSDYVNHDALEAVLDDHHETWCNQEQPTTTK